MRMLFSINCYKFGKCLCFLWVWLTDNLHLIYIYYYIYLHIYYLWEDNGQDDWSLPTYHWSKNIILVTFRCDWGVYWNEISPRRPLVVEITLSWFEYGLSVLLVLFLSSCCSSSLTSSFAASCFNRVFILRNPCCQSVWSFLWFYLKDLLSLGFACLTE